MPTTTTLINAKPKNFLQSKTIWGAIIAGLAGVAPIASTFLGIDITADDINRGATLVAEAVQGVMAVIGFALILIGRFQKSAQPVVFGSTAKSVTMEVPKATSASTTKVT